MKILGGKYLTECDLAAAGFKSLGKNIRVHERASLYGLENISLADDVRIDDFTIIIATGEVTIGRHVSIPTHCFLGGKFGLELQDFVTLAPGVKLFSASDDYSGEFMTGPTLPPGLSGGRRGKITLERHVLLGAGVVVLPGCTLGEGASVGALSLVKSDLPSWGIYAGVPCRLLRPRKKQLLQLVSQLNHTPTT